jgi:MFS family permease
MQRVATGWLVYALTGSAAWLGVEAFAAGIPPVLLMPVGGVLADHVNRRRLLMVGNLINAALAGLLAAAWWGGVLAVWEILAASFLSGVVTAAIVPASQSLLPAVVGEDHLSGAIALNSVQYNVARAVGPALGGIALAWGGPGWCFLLNAGSFLILVGGLMVIGEVGAPSKPRQSIRTSVREGIAFLAKRRALRQLLLAVGVLAFGGAPVVSMLPAFAKEALQGGAGAYSLLLTCFGVGAAVAGVVLTLHPAAKRRGWWVIAAIMGVGVCELGLAGMRWLPAAAGVTVAAGGLFVGAMIEIGSRIVGATPDEYRGRVSSVQGVIFRGAQPLGGLAAGALAHGAGVVAAFAGFGGLLIAGAGVLWARGGRGGGAQDRGREEGTEASGSPCRAT